MSARWPTRTLDAEDRLPAGREHGHDVQPDTRQRLDLELRGQQLAPRPGAPAVRLVDLERRFHPYAGQHALVLPAQLLPGEPAAAGTHGARRPAAGPVHGGPGPVLRDLSLIH